METKLQYYSELSKDSTRQLTKNYQNWTAYLTTAARLYKYPFPEQVMIFTQRPDATACAPIETWNNPMNRYVKRGSKGIALIDISGNRPRLKYVFDVSDTGDGRQNPHRPYLWELKPEHEVPVMKSLQKNYGDMPGNLADILYKVAWELAKDYYTDNANEIKNNIKDSLLDGYKVNINVAFCEALMISTAYSLISRCGLNTNEYFKDKDFQCIFNFNTNLSIYALGTAVSNLSEQVLKEIGETIKNYERHENKAKETFTYERSMRNEQPDIQQQWGLSDTQPYTPGAAGRTDRQIRQDEEKLSETVPPDNIQHPNPDGAAIPTPDGDRSDSEWEARTVNDGIGSTEPVPRQSSGSDGLGIAHEQPASTSGGIDTERTDLQLNEEMSSEQGFPEPDGISLSEQPEQGLYKYYSIRRPVSIGTYPLETKPVEIMNFDNRQPVEGGLFQAWGYLVYSNPLTDKQIQDYELRTAPDYSPVTAGITAGRLNDHAEALSEQAEKNGSQVGNHFLNQTKETHSKQGSIPLSELFAQMPIPIEAVDAILRDGSNYRNSVLRIAAHYMKGKIPAENVAFLKQEYQKGGKGFRINGQRVSAWFDETGMIFGDGPSALHAIHNVHLSWEQVESRIRKLIYDGQYIPQGELDKAEGQERKELAEKLCYLHQDTADGVSYFIDEDVFRNGFPDSTAHIAKLLSQPEQLKRMIDGLRGFSDAYEHDHSLLRFHFHKPQKLLQRLSELQLETVALTAGEIPPAEHMPFVTEDEIEAYLIQGSSYEQGKFRIFSYFLQENSTKDKADFLKNEYGTGGSSHALSGADNSHADYSSDGLTLSRGNIFKPYDKVTLPWNRVARLINALINEGRYMSRAELDNIPTYEKEILAGEVVNFYYKLPVDMERPFPISSDFFNSGEKIAVREMLENPEKVDALLESMRPIWEVTPAGDRYYVLRQKAYLDLTAYRDGTFTLFPQLSAITPPEEAVSSIRMVFEPSSETYEQLSLFPTEEEQRAAIKSAEETRLSPASSISEAEIDTLLCQAIENPESKLRIQRQFFENPRSRETTGILKKEYGGCAYTMPRMDQKDGYIGLLGEEKGIIITKGGSAVTPLSQRTPPVTLNLTWAKIQKRMADLVETGRFMNVPEQTALEAISQDTETAAGQVIEETSAEQMVDTGGLRLRYAVGDTVYLENDRRFVIDRISDHEISLLDPNLYIPIFRLISVPDFEGLLQENPRNSHMFEQKPEQNTIPTHEYLEQIPQMQMNFQITDEHLGEGGAKTKYGYNVTAIHILKQIEAENRSATHAEQDVLSKYVGWGGLPQVFDGDNANWKKEHAELLTLLTSDEYDMARASTLNAHYTSPTVIKAIYETVQRMGFKTGNILEPACGVGNFFGLLPDGMQNSKLYNSGKTQLYGVELDSISGRIARYLYPQANINITGFEKTDMPDSFFDLAIGNVPFGSYKLPDKRYDKHNFLIHDYFFTKTLDLVRPGGIIAFITSKGTLDKKNPEARRYIAQRAELLGAVRLPNNTFLKNAGTEVTSDILFLQKRDRIIDIQPEWVNVGLNNDAIPINSYFVENPHMILGIMAYAEMMYGAKNETTCNPIPDTDLAQQLKTALAYVNGKMIETELDDMVEAGDTSIPADPNVRNFSYALVDDTVFFRENSLMYPVDQPKTTLERIKGMITLRDCAHELIAYQLDEYGEEAIKAKQSELNMLYDGFTKKFGLINDRSNSQAFSSDTAYYLLCSLEVLDENGDLERKADMFTKRTIKQKTVVTSVNAASEALAVSIAEKARVDIGYMAQLIGQTSLTDESDKIKDIVQDLQGIIYKDPASGSFDLDGTWYAGWQTADEYLSGNVREKLAAAQKAAETHPEFAVNVAGLEMVQPKDLDASEISMRLGSTWVDKKYVQQFMYELLETPYSLKKIIEVSFSRHTGEWGVSGTGRVPMNNVLANVTYGTAFINAYEIICDTLNLKDVRIYDTIRDSDGNERRVLNKKQTTLAQQKQEAVKQVFKDWIFKDPERRQTLVKLYNERFNSVRPREYDGSHISLSGINPDPNLALRPHQLNAVARILYGGNTLLAHEVGAGKTFEMVAAAMESKRLGLCQKNLICVPNHLTEQTASEFLRLYPSANLLVATAKDFEMKNRRKFCAKIATGDYDAVIIGHSQLVKIPMSKERQERLLRDQISEIIESIDELKRNRGERFSIKQLEKTKKSLEARLKKLTDETRKDDVVTFEQLGVDRLFVDEVQNFKNLFLYTKMRNVAGLSQTEAQKSSDLFMKCRYMDELTNNKGIIFATGTPVTNSMTELYTMQRYLQYDSLQRKGLAHFDCWASTFGETVTAIELAPEGTGYRARTRFSKFHNLPELMCMFKESADIKTADMLDLPRPKANYQTIVVKPSDIQTEMVAELSERAAAVHNKLVEPEMDNMLKITSDGRKIGLDQRLMNDMLPDEPDSKVNACMNNIFNIWEETSKNRLSQLCFCDFSTPNADGRFNVYDDIKVKLIKKGIPENEIAFIHDANTEARKKELFAKVRKGQVRILFGSTFKMGAGTNVQDRLIAMHDLDCPWRPADLEQRAGRIVRQGNQNPEVNIYRYVTENTFDAYLYQTVENKQKFISQIMSSKSPVRSCEDADETTLSYAEIKALCAGNPLIRQKMDLDIEVARLRLLKADHQSQRYRLEDALIKQYPESIEKVKEQIAGFERDMARLSTETKLNEDGFSPMEIYGITHTEKGTAGAALLEACKNIKSIDAVKIGSYRGFDMNLAFDSFNRDYHLTLKGNMSYSTHLGNDAFGNISRINNVLADMHLHLKSSQAQLENLYRQVENAKSELQKPFQFEQELAAKSERLSFLDAELNMDSGQKLPEQDNGEEAIAAKQNKVSAKSSKSSILEGLKIGVIRDSTADKLSRDKSSEVCM